MKSSKHFLLSIMTIASLLGCAISFDCRGQQGKTGIHFFEGRWKDAVTKAKQEKKCIFFDAYASWCGPCKTMDSTVYTDPEVAEFFNREFISFRVDMEKGEGPELARQYSSIDGYPSLLFFNPDGSLAKTILGSRHAEEFLQEAKIVVQKKE